MKKHIFLFIMILIPIFAQKSKMQILESKQFISSEPIVSELQTNSVPRKISYQGILTKDNGQPADETFYNVKFRLYEMLEGGDPFWEESQLIFIKDGFLTATIGVSNELNYIPPAAFLEVEVGSSVLEPRQEMTSVFYSILSDTAYYAKGYTKTEDLSSVALSGKYEDLLNIPDTLSADLFIGSASGLTGILADSVGVLSGDSPLVFEGELADDHQISLKIEEPSIDTEIILPNTSGTIITTGNDQLIDEVGVISSGIWMGESIEDLFIDNDLDILGGVIDNSPIGDSIPSSARFTTITTQNGLNINDGEILLSNDELGVLDSVLPGQSSGGKAIITNEENDIAGLRNINATGVINAESFAGMFMGDGSNLTGVSANSIKSDDITAGDAAVTISTSTGAINLTPATGSAVVLDGSVNVDGGVVTGVTSLTVSGEASVTTLDIGGTDVTATAAELNVLDGALKETNSIWVGSDPSSTTDDAQKNIAVGTTALDAITTGDDIVAIGYDALTDNTEGYSNTAIGSGSLAENTTGDRNTAVGANALKSNTTGIVNVAVGSSALESNTTANRNTAVGHASSFKLNSGQNNVTIGYEASKNMTSANNNVIVGSDANPSADTGTSNQIVIGYGVTGKGNNTVTIGNGDITTWSPTDDGEVDLGSSSVEFKDLYVDGVAYTDAIGFGSTAMTVPTADGTNGQVLVTDGGGTLSWSSTAGNATRASTLTITDNENTNESNALIFTAGGDVDGGDLGLESDGDATYNPSTGVITATGFSGNLTGTLQTAAQTNVTSLGTLSGLTVSGEASVTTLDIGGTDVTSTAAELNVLDGALKENNSIWIGNNPSSTTNSAEYNYALGVSALASITTGDFNTAMGWRALKSNTTGHSNIGIGYVALRDNVSDVGNVAIGYQSMQDANGAEYNTAVGNNALRGTTDTDITGDENVAIGAGSMKFNIAGAQNAAVGRSSLYNNTSGSNNTAIGYWALLDNTTATYNTAVGSNSLENTTTAGFNTGIGANSLLTNTTGQSNTAGGVNSIYSNSTGNNNTGFGRNSLYATTGSDNTSLGYQAGDVITSGSNNVVIGSGSDPSANTASNQTVIGYGATGQANNSVTLGNADVTAVYMAQDKGATVYAAGMVVSDAGTIGSASDVDAVAISSGGVVTLSATTASTSASSGALVVGGGAGVAADLYVGDDLALLSDAAVLNLGADMDVTITHDADDGIELKSAATADDNPVLLTLQSGETDIAADDVIGTLNFQAPDEGTGTDAILVAAGIEAVSEGDFSATSNATKLSFKTGASEAATEKVAISSAGNLSLTASNTELRFYEGSNYVGFEAPALSADKIWVLPTADGSANQVLKTDGNGALSWSTPSGVSNVNGLSDALIEDNSVYIGQDPSSTTSTAENNISVGITALDAVTTGDGNTAVGYNSLTANTSGTGNVAFGYNTLAANTTADQNLAIGYNALAAQTSDGGYNTAVGNYTLDDNSTGDRNVALGYTALANNSQGSNNVGIGAGTLRLNSTAASNTALGDAAGDLITTGSQNVLLGASTDPSVNSASNQIVVGYGATGQADNSVTLGNADVTAVYMAQDKGATVHAAGISLENDETITNSSNGTVLITATTTSVSGDLTVTGNDITFGNGETISNSTDGTVAINGIVAAGSGSATGIYQSSGDNDVTIKTGNSDTGSITITDGANENITIAPNGTGKADFNDSPLTGFGADVQTETGTSRGLLASDNGTIINCSNGSAISITIPDNLPTGFNCMIIQSGSGQVTLSASSSATLNNKNGRKTSGQYAIITLVHLGSDVFIISGDTST